MFFFFCCSCKFVLVQGPLKLLKCSTSQMSIPQILQPNCYKMKIPMKWSSPWITPRRAHLFPELLLLLPSSTVLRHFGHHSTQALVHVNNRSLIHSSSRTQSLISILQLSASVPRKVRPMERASETCKVRPRSVLRLFGSVLEIITSPRKWSDAP